MLARRHKRRILQYLDETLAVALLGPRQVGKTTLARDIAAQTPDSLYLDLENPGDAARLADPGRYLDLHTERLVILDEVQRMPDLFRVLRGQIDERRRQGRRTRQFLLLGSASDALLRQSSESLAGRIIYDELPGLDVLEVGGKQETLWIRGGFPNAFNTRSEIWATERFVVHPGHEPFPLSGNTLAVPLTGLMERLEALVCTVSPRYPTPASVIDRRRCRFG